MNTHYIYTLTVVFPTGFTSRAHFTGLKQARMEMAHWMGDESRACRLILRRARVGHYKHDIIDDWHAVESKD